MKIIFCGPPHSGKSVLIDWLRQNLPSDGFFTNRIHLDGEGIWSNNPDQYMVQTVRVKEDYNDSFIRQKCEELKKYDNFPIVLVDIGGKLSNDKIPIFKSCDAFVVVCNDKSDYKDYALRWLSFGTKYGCKCLAVLNSQLQGKEEIFGTEPFLTGRITQLERGNHVIKSPRITQTLADIIIKESNYVPNYITEPYVIDFNKVALDLNYSIPRTTSFGQTIYFADYQFENAQKIYDHLEQNYSMSSQCKIYGARPIWLTAMVSIMSDKKGCKDIKVFDINTMDYIPIKKLKKSSQNESKNNNLIFDVIECENCVFIYAKIINPGIFLTPTIYDNVTIPIINENKPLYFSGKFPMWFVDSIMISYNSKVKFVFQPGLENPWICCWDDNKTKIGLSEQKPNNQIDDYFKTLNEKVKQEEKNKKDIMNSKKSTEKEIERTFLVDENIVRNQGIPKHTVEHTFIQEADGSVVRMSNKWGKDNVHKYKRTTKEDIILDTNQMQEQSSIRQEKNIDISEAEYNSYIEYNNQFIIGHAISYVYNMPNNFTALVRHFDNGKEIVTAEIEFADEIQEKDFILPNWLGKEVSHDDTYRGQAMAIANYKK